MKMFTKWRMFTAVAVIFFLTVSESIGSEEDNWDTEITFPDCGKKTPNVEKRNIVDSSILRSKRWNEIARPAIVGGKESKPNSWPWQVALFKKVDPVNRKFFCGGSLISRRYVLTAAHCFDQLFPLADPAWYAINLGMHNQEDGREYNLTRVLRHPLYTPAQYYYDIAIMEVAEDVEFGKTVYPICLPSPSLKDKVIEGSEDVILTGWGMFEKDVHVHSEVLREVDLTLVDYEKCNASYHKIHKLKKMLPEGVREDQICAGSTDGGGDACEGDSGGPLVSKLNDDSYVQLGIVSAGFCSTKKFPGVYTRVSSFAKWIQENTDLGK